MRFRERCICRGRLGQGPESENTIDMLTDGSSELVKAMDVELDLSGRGLGRRGKRFALVAEDGGELTTSYAEEVLKAL